MMVKEETGTMGKSWLLHLVIGVPGEPAWIVYETAVFDLLIQADTEDEARKIADSQGQGERFGIEHPWLSKVHSTCRLVSTNSK